MSQGARAKRTALNTMKYLIIFKTQGVIIMGKQ